MINFVTGEHLLKKIIIDSDLDQARQLEEQMLVDVAQHGFSEAEVFAIKLALEEAFANAIKHGNSYDAAKKVQIEYKVDSTQASFCIADDGPGFKPCAVPDPTVDENLEVTSGRGLMLMRAYMDEVSYNDRGNCVHLVKRRQIADEVA